MFSDVKFYYRAWVYKGTITKYCYVKKQAALRVTLHLTAKVVVKKRG